MRPGDGDMILLIDNFDSFVDNVARYFRRLQLETLVVRNDRITPSDVDSLRPRAIVISPGPCTPAEAGSSLSIIRAHAGQIPMLGICLGHQAIAMAEETRIIRAPEPIHGRQSTLIHHGHPLFAGVPEKFEACRYHSLIVEESTLPPNLAVTCRTADGIVMAIADDHRHLYGLQFHPESILTPWGFQILSNFVERLGHAVAPRTPTLFESEAFLASGIGPALTDPSSSGLQRTTDTPRAEDQELKGTLS